MEATRGKKGRRTAVVMSCSSNSTPAVAEFAALETREVEQRRFLPCRSLQHRLRASWPPSPQPALFPITTQRAHETALDKLAANNSRLRVASAPHRPQRHHLNRGRPRHLRTSTHTFDQRHHLPRVRAEASKDDPVGRLHHQQRGSHRPAMAVQKLQVEAVDLRREHHPQPLMPQDLGHPPV